MSRSQTGTHPCCWYGCGARSLTTCSDHVSKSMPTRSAHLLSGEELGCLAHRWVVRGLRPFVLSPPARQFSTWDNGQDGRIGRTSPDGVTAVTPTQGVRSRSDGWAKATGSSTRSAIGLRASRSMVGRRGSAASGLVWTFVSSFGRVRQARTPGATSSRPERPAVVDKDSRACSGGAPLAQGVASRRLWRALSAADGRSEVVRRRAHASTDSVESLTFNLGPADAGGGALGRFGRCPPAWPAIRERPDVSGSVLPLGGGAVWFRSVRLVARFIRPALRHGADRRPRRA